MEPPVIQSTQDSEGLKQSERDLFTGCDLWHIRSTGKRPIPLELLQFHDIVDLREKTRFWRSFLASQAPQNPDFEKMKQYERDPSNTSTTKHLKITACEWVPLEIIESR